MREHPLVIRNLLRRRDAARVGWALVGVEVLVYPFTLYLGLGATGPLPQLLQMGSAAGIDPLVGISFGIVGAWILRTHPGHLVGWLAVVGGLATSVSDFAGAYAAYWFTHGQVLPAAIFAVWLRGWLWYPEMASLVVLLPLVFPDGKLPSPRWRPVVWAVAAGNVVNLVWVSLSQIMFGWPLPDGPWPQAGWLFGALVPLSGVLLMLPLFAVVAAVVVRFRRHEGAERQQLKWFLAAVGLQALLWVGALIASAVTHQAPYQTPYFEILIPLASLAMPLAIGVAILRYRLYDIDIVISRALVYTGLAAFITVAYLLVVVGIGLALGTGGRPNLALSVIAMAVVAVLIQPLRLRLERLASQVVYGIPADPYSILAEISRTPAGGDVGVALGRIAQAVARGVGGRQVRVRLLLPGGQDRSASWPPGRTGHIGQALVVTQDGEMVGEIEADGSGDHALTEALTGHAGLALRALRLSADLDARLVQLEAQAEELAASRTRLVQAQETERRRLERDLHDGIQQELVVLIAKTRLARNQLDRDPALAAETLVELQGSAQYALANLRSLARGIHPAVLSSRGLVEAIDAMAARLPVGVRVEADSRVRELRYAPEIEGAAYFVVAEALANVLKHSGASAATVTISASDTCLQVAIADDGRGFELDPARESGLRGLRDRVEALGGHVEVHGCQPGTRLDASLPTSGPSHV